MRGRASACVRVGADNAATPARLDDSQVRTVQNSPPRFDESHTSFRLRRGARLAASPSALEPWQYVGRSLILLMESVRVTGGAVRVTASGPNWACLCETKQSVKKYLPGQRVKKRGAGSGWPPAKPQRTSLPREQVTDEKQRTQSKRSGITWSRITWSRMTWSSDTSVAVQT
eukprot:351672-Chlamydomonas_euryale.AAC.4